MDLLPQFSQFTVFLAIAGVGFVFLLIALIFGEVFEHFEAAVEHDLDGGHGGPGFFSTRILSVFVTAFGGFGAVGTHYGFGTFGASMIGFGSGLFFAALIYAFATFLFTQQASSEVRVQDVVGCVARVVVPIPAAGVGQVRCQVGEQLMDKIARSRDGGAIPENVPVTIVEVLGDTVVVEPQHHAQPAR
jgi:membrane protein implicated in regulation of membrane protease activity